MRNAGLIAGTIGGLLLASGVSQAAPLGWQGTLFTTVGSLPPIALTGGGVATVNSSAGTLPAHLQTLRLKGSRGNFAGTGTATDAGAQIAAIDLSVDVGTGSLAPISGGVSSALTLTRRIMPVRGVLKLCLLSTNCTDFVPILLTENGTRGVGIGGLITAVSTPGSIPIHVSLEGAPWTINTASAVDQTGSVSFVNVTRMGFAHGPISGTTSTATVGGVVQLVTPAQIRTNLPQSNQQIAFLAEMIVEFIPEPELLLLLGSGVAGLALLGRSRMKS